MNNNMYIQEKFLEQAQREQNSAIENNRLIALAKEQEQHTQGFIGQFGAFLVALGTHLERVEQRHLQSHA